MIKRIWNDRVGSIVISSLIIGALPLIGIKIKSSYDEKSFVETLSFLMDYPVKLIHIIIGLIAIMLLRWIYSLIFKKKKSHYSKKKLQLKEFNHMTDAQQGVRNEWTVWFGTNGKPFISDLEFFCAEHGDAPLRFYGNNCSMHGCKNSRLNVNEHVIKNHIESLVINKWNKIK